MKRPLFHHHKHTGKLIHHRHTSYPILFVLMAIVGGLMFMTDRIASADDLLVTATVPAPIPAGAPVFTAPDDNSETDSSSITFRGNCPVITPAVIIALYEGSTLLGSGICETTGRFAVTASLTAGAHIVIATVVTITGDNGESSAPLHLSYTPSAPDTTTPPSTTTPSSDANTPDDIVAPLEVLSEKPFITFPGSLRVEWRGRFAGGVTPYAVTLDWGDGKVEAYTVSNHDLQVYTHQYRQSRVYIFMIHVQDANGLTLKRSYVALRVGGSPSPAATSGSMSSFLDDSAIDPTHAAIGIYLCLLLTMLLMWRYEHTHYPYRVIGVPLRYAWQKAHQPRTNTRLRKN